MDIRTRVMESLIEQLRWNRQKTLAFLEVLTEDECDDILEHVREAAEPIVGIAAVVYRVRLRLAGSDQAAKQRAEQEANEHYELLPLKRATGHSAASRPDEQQTRAYRVAQRNGGRRREFDNS